MKRMKPEEAIKLLGLQANGRLSRCPETPNCVCSQYPDDASHFAEPLFFKGTLAEAQSRIRAVIDSMKGAKMVEEQKDGRYLRATFTSGFFRFVDDVEFWLEPEASRIHFRSASRLGRSDLGANKRRMKKIRELLASMG